MVDLDFHKVKVSIAIRYLDTKICINTDTA
jgi:hypothetical protein